MSRFLLDTHILIWWLADAPQLKPEIKRMLECDDGVFYVSAATVWEIGTKQALGKLSVAADLLQAIRGNAFRCSPSALNTRITPPSFLCITKTRSTAC